MTQKLIPLGAQILTFDYLGISSHPNHRSLPRGVAHLLQTTYSEEAAQPRHLRAFGLITVPPIPKYVGPCAALLAKFDLAFVGFVSQLRVPSLSSLLASFSSAHTSTSTAPSTSAPSSSATPSSGAPAVFVAGTHAYATALRAMREHRSQLVWFRWLYVAASRYMWVNEWLEIAPAGV